MSFYTVERKWGGGVRAGWREGGKRWGGMREKLWYNGVMKASVDAQDSAASSHTGCRRASCSSSSGNSKDERGEGGAS